MTRRRMLNPIGRWLWLPAAACACAGVCGLADLLEPAYLGDPPLAAGRWYVKVLMVTPHFAGLALTAWAGLRNCGAGLVALGGSAIMAALSWWDALSRETTGFEYRANNAIFGGMCCGANLLVLVTVACLTLALAASDLDEEAEPMPSDEQSGGDSQEP